MQALIVSFDSLAANSIGCYGNEWIESPNWDRLAATGAVFDRHFIDTLGPRMGMAWATGQHSLSSPFRSSPPLISISCGSRLRAGGVRSHLITTDQTQLWHQSAEFDAVQKVAIADRSDFDPDEVPFAHLVKAAITVWNEDPRQIAGSASKAGDCKPHRLLWLHAPGPGDPPAGFEDLYFEDFEERGQTISELSVEVRRRHPAVYAGSVSLLDHWLGELLEQIQADTNHEPLLIIVMAASGHEWHPLSDGTENPPHRSRLKDQWARTPLILQVHGDDRFADLCSLRCPRLVQTIDLIPTLLDWFALVPATSDSPLAGQSWLRELTEEAPARKALLYGDQGQSLAVRAADWLCTRDNPIQQATDSSPAAEHAHVSLFAKPEDIWDVNDIATQQPEIVEQLLDRLRSAGILL